MLILGFSKLTHSSIRKKYLKAVEDFRLGENYCCSRPGRGKLGADWTTTVGTSIFVASSFWMFQITFCTLRIKKMRGLGELVWYQEGIWKKV